MEPQHLATDDVGRRPVKLSNTIFNKVSFANESWPDGRAKYVPNGLRMVETLLLREYAEEDVVTCYCDNLEKFVGPETKVLAIHAHNPLGISYATDVYAKLFGENLMPLNAHEFLKIVTHPVIKKYQPKIVVGGPGAWQLEKANRLDEFKIDYLIDGEIERVFNDLFKRIMAGDPSLPRIIKVPKDMQATVEEIPVVRHRSTFGVVEITRGCGRGCQFCGPATKVGRSFPLEHIIESAQVNAREGADEICSLRKTCFSTSSCQTLKPMCRRWRNSSRASSAVPGIETIQTSHITMAPVVKDPSHHRAADAFDCSLFARAASELDASGQARRRSDHRSGDRQCPALRYLYERERRIPTKRISGVTWC